jgi:hypothetical protein
MPATGQYLGVSRDKLFDPESNLKAGIAYLKQQYERFPEIHEKQERLQFALASYNGGRGYINRAIALARKEDAPWQTWEGVKRHLESDDCSVSGKHPDHRQIIAYVDSIWIDYARLSDPLRERVERLNRTSERAMPDIRWRLCHDAQLSWRASRSSPARRRNEEAICHPGQDHMPPEAGLRGELLPTDR